MRPGDLVDGSAAHSVVAAPLPSSSPPPWRGRDPASLFGCLLLGQARQPCSSASFSACCGLLRRWLPAPACRHPSWPGSALASPCLAPDLRVFSANAHAASPVPTPAPSSSTSATVAASSRHRRIAPAPAPATLHSPHRPGLHRLAALEAFQVLRQRRRRGITLARLLVQTLQADRFQVPAASRDCNCVGGTGSSLTTCKTVSSGVAALNGGRPVSSSYRIAPSA